MNPARIRAVWPPLVFGISFLLLWELIVYVNEIKPYLLPAPSLIATNFGTDLALMFETASYTATTALMGLVIGSILGILVALLAQRLGIVRKLVTPLALALATVPIIALTPILNNLFDITTRTPRVVVTSIIVFFPVFVNVSRGLLNVAPVQLELMRSLAATPRTVLRVLRVPNSVPFLFTGLKVAAPLAVIAALVAEYFGGPQVGLGSRIASAAANTAYGRAWAYVVASIVTGLIFYFAVLAAERATVPWVGRTANTRG